MIRITLPAFLLLASLVQGQDAPIDLEGVVRDRASGSGIPGAEVSLLGRGLKDTSDFQGKFRIYEVPSGLPWSEGFGKADGPVFLPGRGILIRNSVPGPVHLRILDITGKLYGDASANLGAGIWLMDPGRLEPGAYFGVANTVASRQSFRFVALTSPYGNANASPRLLFEESRPFSKATAGTSAVDSIQVVKSGYFSAVYGITSLIDTHLAIELDAPSGNADLSALVLSAGTLSPAFSSGTTGYGVVVPDSVDSIVLTPTAAGVGATITVNGAEVVSGSASGAIALSTGEQTLNTVVTAQDGSTQKTYAVAVTRAPSGNADLSILILSAGTLSPAFSSGTTRYGAAVSHSFDSIFVTPTAAGVGATITVNGAAVGSGLASGAIALAVGDDTLTTVVTAQDGSTRRTYTVVVARAISVNADLSNLVLSAGAISPAFNPGTTAYAATVPDPVDSVVVTPTAAGVGATITVNGAEVGSGSASGAIALAVGEDTLTTVVTAQDGSARKSYTVVVTRLPSGNAGKWIDSWAASFLPTTVNGRVQSVPSFNNQTYRLKVYTKLGGTQVRVKFSNKFATNTLIIGAAHVAICSTDNSIVTASDRTLRFGGAVGVTLAPGAEVWSDSVDLAVAQHIPVAISVYIPGGFKPTTFHPTGLHTSYISGSGDFTASATLPLGGSGNTTTQVVMVSGLQVRASSTSVVAVAFGHSINDGAGAPNDSNGTWPDVLSNRLPVLPSGAPFAVINMGVGSNRVVSSDLAGPSGLHRFADDALARPNVRYVILLEGINDISYEHASASAITNAYATMVADAHAAGIKVFGATLLPIGNSVKYTAENEATRQAVNAWIRAPGHFDAVLDFEAVVRDTTADPLRIKSEMTFDYVHPNALGYRAIGNSIPTGIFE